MSQHTSQDFLSNSIKNVNVKPGEIYYHYRTPAQQYKILSIALCEATEKPLIIYQALYGNKMLFIMEKV